MPPDGPMDDSHFFAAPEEADVDAGAGSMAGCGGMVLFDSHCFDADGTVADQSFFATPEEAPSADGDWQTEHFVCVVVSGLLRLGRKMGQEDPRTETQDPRTRAEDKRHKHQWRQNQNVCPPAVGPLAGRVSDPTPPLRHR